ncbi:hypothetical protein ROZALSC1DRAFT_29401 [Rozella allomycis CSF55]|uniref:Uncharacterized protein n=1 Tax=Rozella allomycis (strain CSF55) TaxID=988480 RepID=A0A075B373_ROZAC|nr:hypothetical protein O9G_000644 [Rozella allomycis CSF55]RKP18943.1 hypothetical protein ROZALSC1DRAFT_29401 [Rozella allomycis CSF55]|eukprot:EPZ35248.1 hypothetical protein O9G_000644 [Rozella allomycis CSF55]
MNFMTQLFISILISITTEFPFPNPPPLDNVGRLKENSPVVPENIQARFKLHHKQVQSDPAVETTRQISDQIKAQKDVKSSRIFDQNDSIASQNDKEISMDSTYKVEGEENGKISHPQPLTDIYSADIIIENAKPSDASNKDDIPIDRIIDDALKKNKDINENQRPREGETTLSDNTIATIENEKDKDADKKKKGFMEDHIDRILTSIIASVTSTYIAVSTFNKPYRPAEVKKED